MQVTGRKSSWWRELGTSRFSSTSFAGWCRSCAGRAGMDELALAPQQLRSPRWCGRGDRRGRGCGDTGAGPFHCSQARGTGHLLYAGHQRCAAQLPPFGWGQGSSAHTSAVGEPQSEWRGCPAITSATSCDKHQITAEHTHPRQLPRAPRHTAPGQVGGRSTRRTTRQPQQSPVAKFELSPALPGWRDLPGEMGECPCHLML